MAINVAIIGCGLIGKKRAAEVAKDQEARLISVTDVNIESANLLAAQYGCQAFSDWKQALASREVDTVIISTPNYLSAEIAIEAINQGKDILIEKPFGKNISESQEILAASENMQHQFIIKMGFNHRFHPAIAEAKKLVDEQTIGTLYSIRARYGHGGRPGMEKEWRASKDLCGGGELLDQGIHLIDLIQWFAGDWTEVYGSLDTSFWPLSVEDNAYVMGKTALGVHTMFHVSWTQWKNLFSFEIFGSKGSILIQGLGGSYGPETLELAIRNPEGGKPDLKTFTYPDEDISWKLEWEEFKQAIIQRRAPLGSGQDGWKANFVVAAIEQSSQKKIRVTLA